MTGDWMRNCEQPPDLQPRLNFRLLRKLQGVLHLNAEVPHRAFQFGVSQQQLNCANVFRAPVDQGRLRAAYGVGAVERCIKAYFLNPGVKDARVLPCSQVGRA